MGVSRAFVSQFPGSPVPLEFPYSIIYVPAAFPMVTANNECRSLRSRLKWGGNILVLKHGKRKPVINMEREDGYLVDLLVSAYVLYSRNIFCANSCRLRYIEGRLLT
jgi:hypothetical protein